MKYVYNTMKNYMLCCIMITILTRLMESVDNIVASRLNCGIKNYIPQEVEEALGEFGITIDDLDSEIDHVPPLTDGATTWRHQKLNPYDEASIAKFFISKAGAYTKSDLKICAYYRIDIEEVYFLDEKKRARYGFSQECIRSMEVIKALVPSEMQKMQHEDEARTKIVRFHQEFIGKTENRIKFLRDLIATYNMAYLDGNVRHPIKIKNNPDIFESLKTMLDEMYIREELLNRYAEGNCYELPSEYYKWLLMQDDYEPYPGY